MTVSLTKFGHHTTYGIPPEGAGDKTAHNVYYYLKTVSLSQEFRAPATFSCSSSGVGGTITEYYVFEDGYRFVAVLNDDSSEDFSVDESITIVSTTGTETAQLKSWSKVIVGDISLVDPLNPSYHLAIDERGSAYIRFAEGQPILGGFGSLKTSEQQVLGVYESSQASYDDLFTVTEATGGTSSYDVGTASHVLAVTSSNGSAVTRTTNRYHYYLPGSSNYLMQTIACGDTGKTGNVRRWGAFDDDDGVFFQLNGTTLSAVLRSSTSGSVVETVIPQNLWNGDKLDGNGVTGATIDITKVNIYWIDYQWLGAGRIRFGIVEPNGSRLTCHTIENAGKNTRAYMRTGTLPLRTQNINTGATVSGSELREVCMAIYTEGRREDYTFWRQDFGNVPKTVNAEDTHIFSVRSVATIDGVRNGVVAYPDVLSIYTDNPVSVTIWQGSEISGATWDISTGSSVEGSSTGTLTTTNALRFKTFFCGPGVNNFELSQYFETNDEGIMLKADGTPEVWSLTASPLTAASANVVINVDVKELW